MPRKSFGKAKNTIKPRNRAKEILFTERSEWNAQPARGDIPDLVVPVNRIVVTWTDTEPCEFPDYCQPLMAQLQQQDFKEGLPDIRYNFVMAVDKHVYEGRGWDKQPPNYPDTMENADDFNNGKSILVAFVDKNMTIPRYDLANVFCNFFAREMMEEMLARPLTIWGIKDNQFMRFGKMMTDDYWFPEDPNEPEIEPRVFADARRPRIPPNHTDLLY